MNLTEEKDKIVIRSIAAFELFEKELSVKERLEVVLNEAMIDYAKLVLQEAKERLGDVFKVKQNHNLETT